MRRPYQYSCGDLRQFASLPAAHDLARRAALDLDVERNPTMPADHGYYRQPTIHGGTVAFICEDDLWCVAASGGIARRLTANPGQIYFPSFSPDGRWIAFTGRDDGPTEVYVIEADGGPARRLTWLGASCQVAGWRPGGREILFASDWRQPFLKEIELHAVPREGGLVTPLGLGPSRSIAYQPDGPGVVLGRNSGDPARWKRYRGGTAGSLWIDRNGSGQFSRLIQVRGNLAGPMWIDRRVYFLSDHEGYGNLYSCTPTGRDLRRHTDHEDFYVRFPSTDGRRIVYHAGADLFIYDPSEGATRPIDIRLQSPRPQRNRKFVSATKHLEGFDLHPAGHSLISSNRGGLYTMGLWSGAPRRFGQISSARYRLGTWLADGNRVAALTDETGEEALLVLSTSDETMSPEPARRKGRGRAARESFTGLIQGDFGRAIDLAIPPAGPDRIALANQRQEIILVDLETQKSRVLDRSPYNRIQGMSFSPDGRWLAYGYPASSRTVCLRVVDLANGQSRDITRPDFSDYAPCFDPEGRYIYFLSLRTFDPVYDKLYFDLGFPRGARPYLVTLRPDVYSPFSAAHRQPRAPGAGPGADSGDSEKNGDKQAESDETRPEKDATERGRKRVVEVTIDFDGIEDRVVPFPVPEGIYDSIRASKNRVFFTSWPVEGSIDQNWYPGAEPPAKAVLQAYSFDDEKTETVSDRVTSFTLSLNGKTLGIRAGNRIRMVAASHKADGKPVKDEPGRESGWVDLERLRASVIPIEEWRQMFREAWRLQRDQFWTPDMSGLDWQGVFERYYPLVDRVSTRSEFSDLLWELQGELGTSHCYELGGDYRPDPAWHQGHLGADLEFQRRSGTWRVQRIPRGDSWDERRFSPLQAPGVGVREGDEILEVAGFPVGADRSPYECLVHQAGREVPLKVRSRARGRRGAGAAETVRTVVVKTLREETSLRYRDWVESNREWVHRESDGRVGYVHLPNMGPQGYAEFHRYFLSELNRPGLIVDVRYNGGGHVSQLILEKLLRKRIGYDANRWGMPESYPSDAPMGPMIALTNEYAGSDGDIFSHGFKLFGLPFRIICDHHFERFKHRHHARRRFVELFTNRIFEHPHVNGAVKFGDADLVTKIANGRGRVTSPAKSRDCGHSRVIPAGNNLLLDKPEKNPFA